MYRLATHTTSRKLARISDCLDNTAWIGTWSSISRMRLRSGQVLASAATVGSLRSARDNFARGSLDGFAGLAECAPTRFTLGRRQMVGQPTQNFGRQQVERDIHLEQHTQQGAGHGLFVELAVAQEGA